MSDSTCEIGGCKRPVHETMSLSSVDKEYDLCRPCVTAFLTGLEAGKQAYQGAGEDQ